MSEEMAESKMMISGRDYYGNPCSPPSKPPRNKPKIGNYMRMSIGFAMILISLTLMSINAVITFQTQDELRKMEENFGRILRQTRETQVMLRSEVKPKLDLATTFLAVKLPNAVLAAFKKSNNDLIDSLSSITDDLSKLIELYKSLLGFNEDWLLTPTTQYMTCSLMDPGSYSDIYNRVMTTRDSYAKQNGYRINTAEGSGSSDGSSETYSTSTPNQIPPPPPTMVKVGMSDFFNTLTNILNYNRSGYTFQNTLTRLTSLLKKQGMDSDETSTRNPATPTPPVEVNTGSFSYLKRKRRFAADLYQRSKSFTYLDGSNDNYMTRIYTLDDGIDDLCYATKQVIDNTQDKTTRDEKVLQYIKCITDGK